MATKTKIILASLCLIGSGIAAHRIEAATLYVGPASAQVQVGKTVTVGIYVSSPSEAINAASGTVSFSKDKLEVVSVSKSGSIFSLWVQEPSFSNTQGTTQFEGIILNPGFQGSGGKLLTVQFRAKAPGEASITFSASAVLANDGQGTSVLTGIGNGRITISVPITTPPAEESTTPAGVPFAPKVTSSTHPDPNSWYANNDPSFSWNVPVGVTGVSVRLDDNPSSDPGTRSDGSISSKSYSNVGDGTWYFHVRMRNAQGWGSITHFRTLIDTKPPEPFTLIVPEGKETENPRPGIIFTTTDTTSGVDYYRVKIGEKEAIMVTPTEAAGKPYELPALDPGRRTIVVQAFDKAGNSSVATEEIVVTPLTPPTITAYEKELIQGSVFKAKGVTYPSSKVIVRLRQDGGSPQDEEIQSDIEGNFEIIWPTRVKSGLYDLSARVTDVHGAKSEFSQPVTFNVVDRAVLRIGSLVIDYLSVIITLLSLLLLLSLMILYGWYRLRRFRERLRKEVLEVEKVLHGSFDMLREQLEKQIHMLEHAKTRRELTEEEMKLLRQLRSMLDMEEEEIREEVADIEKVSSHALRSDKAISRMIRAHRNPTKKIGTRARRTGAKP